MRRSIGVALGLAGWLATAGGQDRARGQLQLADDIIIAASEEKAKEEDEREGGLHRSPGEVSSLFGNLSEGIGTSLTDDPGRAHRELLLRGVATDSYRMARRALQGEGGRARVPEPLAPGSISIGSGLGGLGPDDPGPAGGMTLEAAIARLMAANLELQITRHELSLAEAEVLTAGLRKNPLVFYDSTSVPYGSYSRERPGSVDHGISLIYPIDYSGKRRAKLNSAEAARLVRVAQVQNTVRLKVDEFQMMFIDAIEAREAIRDAERSLDLLGRALAEARSSGADDEAVSGLIVDEQTARMRLEGDIRRYRRLVIELAELLAIPTEHAAAAEPRGTLRDTAPPPPPVEALVGLALERRPDVVAHRLGLRHAYREFDKAKADRFPSAYALYTPLGYIDNRAPGERDVLTWGAGVFLPLPILDRNQGNIRRAEVNISRTRTELTAIERKVAAEVLIAFEEYEATGRDLHTLEREVLPIILRKRERAQERHDAGELAAPDYLKALGDHGSTLRHYHDLKVRHRRSMLNLNTAVGCRVLP